MKLRKIIRAIWIDPVWSKVISGIILTVLGYIFDWLRRSPSLSGASAGWLLGALSLISLYAAIAVFSLAWLRRRTKTLVFLSYGGTCRDPMAKVIATKLLSQRRLKHRIDIRAACFVPSVDRASVAAKYVMKEMFNEPLLEDHKPEPITPGLIERADLILAMSRDLVPKEGKGLPRDKTFLFKEFFGLQGDVTDPWLYGPDAMDDETISRYRLCANEIRQILADHLDELVKKLDL